MLTRSRSRFCKTRWSSPARSRPGHDLVDQRRRRGPDPVEQPFDLLAGQQLVGVVADDLAEVAGDDRRGLEDPAAGQLGHLAAVGVDPDRRLARDRVDAVAAVGPGHQPGRRHGQQPAGVGDPLPDDRPADLDPIFVRRQADLVVDPHLRHDQAELAGHPLADRPEPVEQVAAAGRVGQADQPDSRSPARADRRAAGPPSAPSRLGRSLGRAVAERSRSSRRTGRGSRRSARAPANRPARAASPTVAGSSTPVVLAAADAQENRPGAQAAGQRQAAAAWAAA